MRITELTPTPLFPPPEAGRLEQIARLRLDAAPPPGATAEVLTRDGRTSRAPLAVERGPAAYDVRVPETEEPGAVQVRVLGPDGGTLAADTVRLAPVPRWTVCVMPTSHIDLYSTGLAHETPEEHAGVLDAALALAEAFPDYRYQIENALPLFEFRHLRAESAMGRLVDRIHAGQIAFGAQYTGLHQEEALAEELVQGQFLKARELEAAYGIRPNCGYTVDVPNTAAQYAQLLAQCGIRGWIFSPNRFPPPDGWYGTGQSIRRLPYLIRAQGLDGSGVLAWLPHEHYGEDQKLFGLEGADVDAAATLVADRLLGLQREGYPWDTYLLEHSYGDNLPPTDALPRLIAAWRERYAFPRLVMATAGEFFAHAEASGCDPPAMKLQVTDAWAYIVANQGVLNQMARRAAHDLLRTQAMRSLGSNCDYPEDRLREAFSELAKFEAHDWWYGGGQVAGVPDLAKAGWAHRAEEIARELAGGEDRAGGPQSLPLLFNPVAFARRDIALLPAAAMTTEVLGQAADGPTVATHFQPRPHTVAHPPASEATPDAVVLVAAWPGLGWSAPACGGARPSRRHRDSVLENRHFRLRFDPDLGAVASIIERESGRELVQPDPHGFGQLLLGQPQFEGFGIGFAGTYEQAVERMSQSLKSWEAVRLEMDEGRRGPVFCSLLLRGRVGRSPVTEAVVLYEELDRIDVTVTIDWDNQPSASRLVVSFPFALSPFTTRYEAPFGALEVGRDEMPIVPRHLRQLQTWLQFSEGERSVVVASPDVGVFSLGRCDLNPVEDGGFTVPERPTAYFVLTDNGAPSPLVQPGRLAARFSLTSGHGLRPSDCARFGWGFARPPLSGGRPGGEPAPMLSVEPDSLLVSAVKRSWDGSGLVVRVVEYDGVAADAQLRLPFAPKAAWLADPAEHPIRPATVEGAAVCFPVAPHEVVTLLIESRSGGRDD